MERGVSLVQALVWLLLILLVVQQAEQSLLTQLSVDQSVRLVG